jgi:hypothetical protein
MEIAPNEGEGSGSQGQKGGADGGQTVWGWD